MFSGFDQHMTPPVFQFDDATGGESVDMSTNYGYNYFDGHPDLLTRPSYTTAVTSAISDNGVTPCDKSEAHHDENIAEEGWTAWEMGKFNF